MKKRKGNLIAVFTAWFCVTFVWLFVAYGSQIHIYRAVQRSAEDALVASNLASAVIDLNEYGASRNLVITDAAGAFALYKDTLKYNMGLDESWNSIRNGDIITGPVVVEEYIIYNVIGNDVEVIYFGTNHYSQTIAGGKGSVRAPNGTIIDSTSVYSKITFPVTGIFHIQTIACKEKLVDIVL